MCTGTLYAAVGACFNPKHFDEDEAYLAPLHVLE
jgi:hypothetical protein